MARIFTSHSSKDNAEAIALTCWLEAEGRDDYFLDLHPEREIVAGALGNSLHDAAHR